MCVISKGRINENSYMKDVLKVVGKGSQELVIFDLDKTSFEVLAEEATESWFFSNLKALMREGYSEQSAKAMLLPLIEEAQCKAMVRLVDPCFIEVMRELRARKVRVIALTARTGKMLARATFRQLRDVGISFDQPLCTDTSVQDLWQVGCEFPELCEDVFYQDGVLFVDGKDKGLVLELFFQKIGYCPGHIVFVDDSINNVKAVQKMAERLKIAFDGFHFTHVDDRLAAAAIQVPYDQHFSGLNSVETCSAFRIKSRA